MSDDLLAMEEELSRLRPLRPSRRVSAGVARRLAPRPPARLAPLAALAAGVLLVFLTWPSSPPHRPPAPAAPAPGGAATPPPVIAAYRQALAVSPEELERLLDRQAAEAAPGPETTSFVGLSSRHLSD
jgi:hypothetical protein